MSYQTSPADGWSFARLSAKEGRKKDGYLWRVGANAHDTHDSFVMQAKKGAASIDQIGRLRSMRHLFG